MNYSTSRIGIQQWEFIMAIYNGDILNGDTYLCFWDLNP